MCREFTNIWNDFEIFSLINFFNDVSRKIRSLCVVYLEAMSFGKLIIASKIKGSGVDWVNKNQVSGINVRSNEACKEIMLLMKYMQATQKIHINNFLTILNVI